MPKFSEIPQFTRHAGYMVDVSWDYPPTWYVHHVVDYKLDVSPDFQRGHVWTETQKIRFCFSSRKKRSMWAGAAPPAAGWTSAPGTSGFAPKPSPTMSGLRTRPVT